MRFLGRRALDMALALNVIASGVVGPAIACAGQACRADPALWEVFVWREFRNALPGAKPLVTVMLGAYTLGIVLMGRATL